MKSQTILELNKTIFFVVSASLGIWLWSVPLIIISLALLFLIILEKQSKITIPTGLSIVFILFIVCSLVLGSYFDFYERFLWWDDALHAFYGAAFAVVGFLLIQFLSHIRGISNDPLIICLFSLCFSIALGAVWEIYEFAFDTLTGGNMQRTDQGTGVTDTMKDIILESGAALLVNISIYYYITTGAQNWIGRTFESLLKTNTKTSAQKQ